jgi:hypothetical protein
MRRLYERGMPDQEIRTMYEFIDWTMILPEALEDKFWHELKTFEESQKMAYVTLNASASRKVLSKVWKGKLVIWP